VSNKHSSRIQSHLSPLDSRGDENFTQRSSNGAAAHVFDQTMVETSARDGDQHTGAVNHDLSELVWKYFENEIREALREVQDEINNVTVGDDVSHRKRKGNE
jgi:hypothetical protein